MKKLVSLLLAGALSFGLLAGCGGGNSGSANTPANNTETTPVDSTTPAGSTETSSVPEGTVIRVAASPTPHAEILKVAKEVLAEQGITLEIEEFTDYIQPNMVTEDGQVDANYFQHITYLNDFNEQNGTHLVSVADLHYEPFGIYAGKTTSLADLPDGAVIGVPNDPTNEGRALLLLQQEGLITLKEGAGLTATKLDIAENPKNLDIQELEAAQLPRSLDSLDLAVINGNYALQAGLNAADALAVESTDGEAAQAYVNVLVVKEGREEDPAIQALVDALKSDEVKAYMEETWPSAVVPMF
ncbi:MetQ/NlpA family ABC transporter substrate-binding protein [uncultured Flavonifractor sp.]|uniref:MetQ/NlpA family ABC transporter substrate-binding protein n=1 Tax=uncultured Flavonifractor sp. TaxID=1193534 RepID=UPI00260766E8|nr:MetQ/NlpA family ABC transporter substrate-binding protein [uncultured Flavonifractor sp.]